MPLFEYVCKDCRHPFEALIFGQQEAECPKCQSQKLEPQLSVFAVAAAAVKSGQSQPAFPGGVGGGCGSCGDPRGPGACSMNNI